MTTADPHGTPDGSPDRAPIGARVPDEPDVAAAAWLIALREEPDDAGLRRRFDAWRESDPANAAAWTAVARVYGALDQAVPARHRRSGRAARRPAGRAGTAVPPASRSRRLAWTAGAVALAACLVLLLPAALLQLRADVATGTAELRTLRLQDGSTVWLGPESAVSVSFAEGERTVRLLEGEAFFEVASDPARPFRVAAGQAETVVLGTAFEMRRGASGVGVAVHHGRVRASLEGAPAPVKTALSEPLTSGQWLQLTWAGGMTRGTTAPDEVAAWRHGLIVAHDRPLADVLEELRGYFAGRIVLVGDDLARRSLTGVYDTADPAAALRGIASAHDARVLQVTPWLLVLSGH